jgi:hypothetical protein
VAQTGTLTIDAVDGVLATDLDVDSATLSASLVSEPAHGVLSFHDDGSFTYTPMAGFNGQDAFTYKASDGSLESAITTVTITVNNNGPQVDDEIDDLTLTDSSSQPTYIDLSAVFSDPDGDALTYSVDGDDANTNEYLVAVAIDGDTLEVSYIEYDTYQDRTPAYITVTATDPFGNEAEDTFRVTVEPRYTAEAYVVIRDTATPVGETVASELPSQITDIAVNSTYVVEIWIRDTLGATVGNGPSAGLNGGWIDILFDSNISSATAMYHDGPFDSNGVWTIGTIDNDAGLVDEFGDATLDTGVGLAPNFTRLGYVTFQADATGSQIFSLDDPNLSRHGASPSGGTIDESQVYLKGASIAQIDEEPYEFTANSWSSFVEVDGVINGAELYPVYTTSHTSEPFGDLKVYLDSLDEPTRIKFVNSTLGVSLFSNLLHPGVNGVDGVAPANFGLSADVSEGTIEMAIRDLTLDVGSDWISLEDGISFSGNEIDMAVAGGALDMRAPATGGERVSLDAIPLVAGEESWKGTYVGPSMIDGSCRIGISFDGTIDLTGLTPSIAAGSYLRIYGSIDVVYAPTDESRLTEGASVVPFVGPLPVGETSGERRLLRPGDRYGLSDPAPPAARLAATATDRAAACDEVLAGEASDDPRSEHGSFSRQQRIWAEMLLRRQIGQRRTDGPDGRILATDFVLTMS